MSNTIIFKGANLTAKLVWFQFNTQSDSSPY